METLGQKPTKETLVACIHTLADNVLGWAKERGILANSTAQKQMLKLVSEMGELSDNLAKGRDVKDDIGDCLGTSCLNFLTQNLLGFLFLCHL